MALLYSSYSTSRAAPSALQCYRRDVIPARKRCVLSAATSLLLEHSFFQRDLSGIQQLSSSMGLAPRAGTSLWPGGLQHRVLRHWLMTSGVWGGLVATFRLSRS